MKVYLDQEGCMDHIRIPEQSDQRNGDTPDDEIKCILLQSLPLLTELYIWYIECDYMYLPRGQESPSGKMCVQFSCKKKMVNTSIHPAIMGLSP